MTDVRTAVDRGLYALFSRHADRPRHDRDRDRYRGAALNVGFDTYLARVYGASWLLALVAGGAALSVVLVLPAATLAAVGRTVQAAVPVLNQLSTPDVPDVYAAAGAGLCVGAGAKFATVRTGGAYLKWRAEARRSAIERTLPGAVRYLRALADGSEDRHEMLRKVAKQDAYGETSDAFELDLRKAALMGSLDAGLRSVARETP